MPPEVAQWGGALNSPIPERAAMLIYSLLILEAEAKPDDYYAFKAYMTDPGENDWREFRFQGALGFGGKCKHNQSRIYISCYAEDETPERRIIINKVNYRLGKMFPKEERDEAN